MRIHVNQIDENSLSGKIASIIEPLLTGLDSSVSGAVSDISDLSSDVSSISGSMITLETDISNQSGRLSNFESDFYNFQSGLNSVSGNNATLSGDLNNLSGDLSNQISDVEYNLNLFTGDVSDLNSSVSSINSSLGIISGQFISLSGDLSTLDTVKLESSLNLSDLSNKASGLANLNLRHQYLWLNPADFVIGATAATGPILSTYQPVFGSTGIGTYSRLSVPILQYTGFGAREAFCTFSLPSNWDKGRVYPKIYSTPVSSTGTLLNTGTGNAIWKLSAEYFNDNTLISGRGAPEFVIKSSYTGSSNPSGVLSIAPSVCSGMTISGVNNNNGFDNLIILKVARDPAETEDDLDRTVNLGLLKIGLEYTVTGSSTRWAEDLI